MSFRQWADEFDRRHRFGIPTTPITRRERRVPPSAIQLPTRAGAFKYSDEDVKAVLNLLADPEATAVALQDAPEPSENKARRKCQIIREQIEALPPVKVIITDESELADYPGKTPEQDEDGNTFVTVPVLPDGYFVRGHCIGVGDADSNGVFPAYMPAVSVAKRTGYTPPATGAPDATDGDDDAPPPADDAPPPDAPPADAPSRGRRGR